MKIYLEIDYLTFSLLNFMKSKKIIIMTGNNEKKY